MERSKTDVTVLVKAFDLLEQLAEGGRLGLSTLSKRAGITKASAYRILSTLEGRGYLTKDGGDRNYAPGHRLVRLCCAFVPRSTLVTSARPILERLHSEFGETVNLATLNESSAIYIAIIESDRGLRMAASVGQRDPLHSTALGKAILAHLPEEEVARLMDRVEWVRRTPNTIVSKAQMQLELQAVREQGYAVDDEENEPGARCVAAPILAEDGGSPAALSISGPAARMDDPTIALMGKRLKEAAREIAGLVGPSSARSRSEPHRVENRGRKTLQSAG